MHSVRDDQIGDAKRMENEGWRMGSVRDRRGLVLPWVTAFPQDVRVGTSRRSRSRDTVGEVNITTYLGGFESVEGREWCPSVHLLEELHPRIWWWLSGLGLGSEESMVGVG